MPDRFHLTLAVRAMTTPGGAYYNPCTRTVTVIQGFLIAEDPRVVAAALAHELQRASDRDLVAVGLLPRDCMELEAASVRGDGAGHAGILTRCVTGRDRPGAGPRDGRP